ncbi:hypothetical protein [uncultured Legionella sp.]|uniref:hypothetical protein n=1 Tax=uncultured Legionella sp. TaxID=210934 RepID=UPI002624A87E|nr:hypothetical protein [uncultured Legionella sp.]
MSAAIEHKSKAQIGLALTVTKLRIVRHPEYSEGSSESREIFRRYHPLDDGHVFFYYT